jgi:DNA-binding transcriptional LysR family regulator
MLETTRAALMIADGQTEAARGLVRLNAPKAFARHVLQAPLLSFLKRCPEVDVLVRQGRITLNHSSMRLDAIAAGLGVGCVPDFVATKALSSGQLVEVLPDGFVTSPNQGTAWLLYAADGYRTPKVRALAEHLLSVDEHLGDPLKAPPTTPPSERGR